MNSSSSQSHHKRKIKKIPITSPQKHQPNNDNTIHNSLPLRSQIPVSQHNSNANSYHQNQMIFSDYSIPQHTHQLTKGIYPITNLGLVYSGTILNNKFHGQGTLSEPQHQNTNKYVYRGSWTNGARNGFGHYIYPDGSEYRGNWKNNLKDGQGTYTNLKGQKYIGQWLSNQRHGPGKLQLATNITIDGEWQTDKLISGRIQYPDGSSYLGQTTQYTRNGSGIYTYPDKSQYKGQWLNNHRHGIGQYYFINGDQYHGGFLQNMKHGYNVKYIWKQKGYELVDGNFVGDKYQFGNVRKI